MKLSLRQRANVLTVGDVVGVSVDLGWGEYESREARVYAIWGEGITLALDEPDDVVRFAYCDHGLREVDERLANADG